MTTYTIPIRYSYRTFGSDEFRVEADSLQEAQDKACAALHRWAEFEGLDDFDISDVSVGETVA